MNSEANNLASHETPHFSLQAMFVLVTFFAIYVSTATVIGLEVWTIFSIGLIIAIRVPIVFLARRFKLTVPLFILQLAIPILMFWPLISEFASSRFEATLGYAAVYLAIPLFMFLVDSNESYRTKNQKLLRLLVEFIFIIVWGGVTCVILFDVMGN